MKEENISRFMKDGKITVLPKKQKNKMEIFEFIYAHLKNHSETYTEKELNEKIKELYDDFATMRRYLVDYKFVIRDDYGKSYQLNPEVELEN